MKRYNVVSTTTDGVTTTAISEQSSESGYVKAVLGAFTSLPAIFNADGDKVLVSEKEMGIASATGMGAGFLIGDWYGHRAAAKGGRSFVSRVIG